MFDPTAGGHPVALSLSSLMPGDDRVAAPPRPLRLVQPAPVAGPPAVAPVRVEPRRRRPACPPHARCAGRPRPVGTSRAVRRRRVALATVAGGLITALALPWSGTGGRPLATPGPALAGLAAHHASYTVRPGDTLWSIASRIDPTGDPRPVVEQLASEVGGDNVYPGEQIALP
jgi:Tfp pilus assembly protein FimV